MESPARCRKACLSKTLLKKNRRMYFYKILLVLSALMLLSGLCLFIHQGIYSVKEPCSQEQILFNVRRGDNLLSISNNLEKQELIKSRVYFWGYVLLKGEYKGLQAGTYVFTSSISVAQMADKIIQGQNVKIKITIPEGLNLQEIEGRINQLPGTKHQVLNIKAKKAGGYKQDYQFLKDTPDNTSLEGFLFPDTYEFLIDTQIQEIIAGMLTNFDKQLNPELKEDIKRQGKTIFEIVTMASLLEKEVRTAQDKKTVSGILWKRLKNNMPLQIDATIVFITGQKTTNISRSQTQIDSPYNTYKYKGLPIGPICSPGIESILASIYPQENGFWYYLSTPEGETIFSQTLKEHNVAKAHYLK